MARILIVDDDPSLVELLRECLESEGYSTFGAYEGQTALRAASDFAPDLILLDVLMVGTDGLQIFKALRGSALTRDIPVIFITGAVSTIVYPAVMSGTRVTYLKKPVDLDELSSLVRFFLERYPRLSHH